MCTRKSDLTGDTGQQLFCKALDVTVWKRYKSIPLEEVEQAATQQLRYNANVSLKVEAISEMNAFVFVVWIVLPKCLQDSKLYLRGVSILLHGSNYLDGDGIGVVEVPGLDDLSEGSLTNQALYLD